MTKNETSKKLVFEILEQEKEKMIILPCQKLLENKIKKLDNILNDYFPKFHFQESFIKGSLKRFLKILNFDTIELSLEIACTKFFRGSKLKKEQKEQISNVIPYFCGICWNEIRGVKHE